MATTRTTVEPGRVERLIRDEHAAVRDHLGHLAAFARALPGLDDAAVRERSAAIVDFLTNGLMPHAAVEEAFLYPAVDRLLGPDGTRTMSLDHEAIASLVAQLEAALAGPLGGDERAEAQRLLFVLEAFVRIHLHKEEVAYAPLLGRLDAGAYAALAAGIAAHAAEHGHAH